MRPYRSASSAAHGCSRTRRRARELEPCDKHRANSIPIARHRLRGRFSPTGSFAHPTRTSTASMIAPRAPRRPGKRLSALSPVPAYVPLYRHPSAAAAAAARPDPWHLRSGRCRHKLLSGAVSRPPHSKALPHVASVVKVDEARVPSSVTISAHGHR